MTKLSVNINKVATIRNARGGNVPNVVQFALDCERFGAQGITVHPRPDQRHIRYQDVIDLKPVLKTEFNIEGNPTKEFIELVTSVIPAQVTLVPDEEHALTSHEGWDTIKHFDYLKDVISTFKSFGIRTSIFIDTDLKMIEKAKEIGTNRIELYTEPYASNYHNNKVEAILPFAAASRYANDIGLEINAGHDLSLDNLRYFKEEVPFLDEVSIGHALISDALYYGIENTIQMYLNQLR